MEFKRPEGSPYPKIFSSFKAKAKDSDDFEEYFIQDLTEEYFDRAVDFIVENHATGGVLHRAAKTLSSPNGLINVRQKYRSIFEEKVSLICLKAGSQEIAGLNALCIKTKENFIAPSTSNDPNIRRMNEASNYINGKADAMKIFNVDRLMCTAGLCVGKTHSGRGIATEILKSRALLLKTLAIELTTSIFSTVGAQKAAKKAGYEEIFSRNFEELQKDLPEMDFSHAFGTSCRVLALKI